MLAIPQAQAEFTIIQAENTGAVKTQPIYILIESLVNQQHPLVTEYKLNDSKNRIVNNSRQAFLFHFKTAPTNLLHPDADYRCTRHLTVFKTYTPPKTAYVEPHYTEEYVHRKTGAKITYHLYFVANTPPVLQVTRAVNSNAVAVEDTNGVSAYSYNLIQNNACIASYLLEALKLEHADRWGKQQQKADDIEIQLAAKSEGLNLAEGTEAYSKLAEEYFKLAKDFYKAIKQLNTYIDDKIDCRDQHVAEYVTTIQLKLEVLKTEQLNADKAASLQKQGQETNSALNSELNLERAPQQESQLGKKQPTKQSSSPKRDDNILQQHFAKLQQLNAEFDLLSQQNNEVELYKLLLKTNMELLELYPVKGVTTQQQALLQAIETKIAKVPAPLEIALHMFEQGKPQDFNAIFSLLNNSVQKELINKIIRSLVQEENDNQPAASAQREICDGLFKNSAIYRSRILAENRGLNVYEKSRTILSTLAALCMSGKKHTFAMFLRHGVSANGVGCVEEGVVMSIFRTVLQTTRDPFFVVQLLAQGASIDAPQNVYSEKFLKDTIKELKKTLDAMPAAVTSAYYYDPVMTASDLVAACSAGHYIYIDLLLAKTSLNNLILALAMMLGSPDMECAFHLNKGNGLQFCESKSSADAIAANFKPSPNTFRLVFYPCSTYDPIAQAKFAEIPKLLTEIERRCKQADVKLADVFEELHTMKKENTINDLIFLSVACKIVISLMPALNDLWALNLICYCCVSGNAYVTSSSAEKASKIYNTKPLVAAKANYAFVLELGKKFKLEKLQQYIRAEIGLRNITANEFTAAAQGNTGSSSSSASQASSSSSSASGQRRTIPANRDFVLQKEIVLQITADGNKNTYKK